MCLERCDRGENIYMKYLEGFPGGSDGKESTWNAGYVDSIPGSGRAPGEGNGYPLQYSRLENFLDEGAWQATIHWGHKESDTTEATNNFPVPLKRMGARKTDDKGALNVPINGGKLVQESETARMWI